MYSLKLIETYKLHSVWRRKSRNETFFADYPILFTQAYFFLVSMSFKEYVIILFRQLKISKCEYLLKVTGDTTVTLNSTRAFSESAASSYHSLIIINSFSSVFWDE